jgi:hypothetical protein
MNGAELLGGGNAVKFFEKSGLEIQSLKQIWSRCTPNPAMSKQEFFVALRYIAMAQNGFPISRGEYKDLMYVKLYNFPCLNKQAENIKMSGHVKDVSKVRFTADGK